MIPFIKITLAVPKLIAPAKRLLEKREVNFPDFNNISYAAFESNIDFEIRFMADTKVVGCNWIELPAKKHQIHRDSGNHSTLNIQWDMKSRLVRILNGPKEIGVKWFGFRMGSEI